MKLHKGDLIEYVVRDRIWVRYLGESGVALVQGTDEDWWCIRGHVSIKDCIVPTGYVTRMLTRGLVPPEAF